MITQFIFTPFFVRHSLFGLNRIGEFPLQLFQSEKVDSSEVSLPKGQFENVFIYLFLIFLIYSKRLTDLLPRKSDIYI